MDKVILHTLSKYFPAYVTFGGVKPLIAAGLFDIDTNEFRFYTPDNAKEIPDIIVNASLLVTFNGSGNALPILKKYFGLRGRTSKIPYKGKHIQIKEEISKLINGREIKFEEAIKENLSEERLVPQSKLWRLKPEECYEACLSDITQIKKLYVLFVKNKLRCPVAKKKRKYKSIALLEKQAKLTIELVPETSWFSSVRSKVSKKDWDIIRRDVYKKADYKCEICGGVGERYPVACHEIWKYYDDSNIQRLYGFISLCPSCHEVKHMGFANVRDRGDIATEHLAKVNNWPANDASRYVKAAFKKWCERSTFEWEIDLSLLDEIGIEYKKS